MTEKQRFDKALALVKESSELYRIAMREFEKIGIELYPTRSPIERFMGKPEFFIISGVERIAEINGTAVKDGQPFYCDYEPDRYTHTIVDGILIYQMENVG